jgi:acetyltransferase-like isoleucine patch superfamily enzyme
MSNIFFDISSLRHLGKDVIIGKAVRIRHPEKVSIGDNTIIDDFTYISGEVNIGKYVHIASSCAVQATAKSKVSIGDFAGLSSGVRVFAGSAEYVNCSFDYAPIPASEQYGGIFEEVKIGQFVQVGANSVVLPGTVLPNGFTCGALNKLTRKIKYLRWNCLADPESGASVRRTGVVKLLESASKLTGQEYER